MAPSSAAVSGTVSTTGSRLPRFALATWETPSTSMPSTSRQRRRIAQKAWFWVLADTL
jgi:hypothetical protein